MSNFWDTLNTYLKLIVHYFQLIVIFHIPTVGFYIWKTHYLFTWSQIPEEIMNFKWVIHIVLLTLLLYLQYRINVKILHHLEYISTFSLRSPICLQNQRTVRSLVMLNYQSVFTETIFITLLFLCNSVKVAQLVKDKKGKTCIHKLKRRWQWTKISEASNLECRRRALVCVLCSAPGISVTDPWAGCGCSQLFFAILLLCSFWPRVPVKQKATCL